MIEHMTPEQYRNAALLAMSEKEFQAAVVALARHRGYRVYHTFDSRRSAYGYPDLTLVNSEQRRVLWMELKSEKGKVSAYQLEWIEALREAGFEAYLFRPSDWAEIEQVLTRRESR